MKLNDITSAIIGAAIEVHKALGPGLLESAYESCLQYELIQNGLYVERQHPLPLIYKQIKLEQGYRLDLWVEKRVVIEIKSTDAISDIHIAQTLTYLKLSKSPIGLILNFNTLKITNGIKRLKAREEWLNKNT